MSAESKFMRVRGSERPSELCRAGTRSDVKIRQVANRIGPNEIRQAADKIRPNELRQTAGKIKPNEIRQTADKIKPNEIRQTAGKIKPDEIRQTANKIGKIAIKRKRASLTNACDFSSARKVLGPTETTHGETLTTILTTRSRGTSRIGPAAVRGRMCLCVSGLNEQSPRCLSRVAYAMPSS